MLFFKKVKFVILLFAILLVSNVFANNNLCEDPNIVLLSNNPKTIYLTFDDGPSKNTKKILDILDKYNVKATFFLLGKSAEYLKDTVKDIYNRGHAIGCHGYSHDYECIYGDEDKFFDDLDKGIDAVKKTIGEKVTIYRFPGGSNNAYMKDDFYNNVMKRLEDKYNMTCFDWNVTSVDSNPEATFPIMRASVFSGINTQKKPIILFHDLYKTDVIALCEQIIVEGLIKGYSFSVLDKDMSSFMLKRKK